MMIDLIFIAVVTIGISVLCIVEDKLANGEIGSQKKA